MVKYKIKNDNKVIKTFDDFEKAKAYFDNLINDFKECGVKYYGTFEMVKIEEKELYHFSKSDYELIETKGE